MEDAPFAALDAESYVSLATFRRDGREVRTPVWFARRGARLYVFSEGDAGKVKRLRSGSRARLAACGVTGRVHGDWIEARGRIVDDPEIAARGYAALHAKYGWRMRVADLFSGLTGRRERRALLELEPAPDAGGAA